MWPMQKILGKGSNSIRGVRNALEKIINLEKVGYFCATQPPWAICRKFGALHWVCWWNKLVLYVGIPGKLSSKYFPGNFWRKSTFHICTSFWHIYDNILNSMTLLIASQNAKMVRNLVHWQRINPSVLVIDFGGHLRPFWEQTRGRSRTWEMFWSRSESEWVFVLFFRSHWSQIMSSDTGYDPIVLVVDFGGNFGPFWAQTRGKSSP